MSTTQIKLSNYRTSTILMFISLILLLILNLSSILVIRYFFRQEAILEAEEKAQIILDRNLSIHDYFNTELKPSLFETLGDSLFNGNYFDPVWMSSSHAVIRINKYFQNRNNYGYYYKDATLDARNPRNEADSIELMYLEKLKVNPELPPEKGLTDIEGINFFYLLGKGETMGQACLHCHDTPNIAPKGLIAIYGDQRSFHRKVGDIISVVSIRIPIEQTLKRANHNILLVSIVISIAFIISYIIFFYFQKKWIIQPIKSLSKESILISKDNNLLGQVIKIEATKDITDFIDSFNMMSNKLHDHQLFLEEKIKEKTTSLEEKITEISEINKTKDKFFSIIAHDLKGPFNTLIGFSLLLKDEILTYNSEDIQKLAGHIHNKSQQTYNLLSNLLEWSLAQTGNIKFNPTQINLFTLVDNIVSLVEPDCKRKNIVLKNELLDDLTITGDKNLLEIIIRNLVSNSVKYTTEGVIEISAVLDKDFIEISITDSGCGISPENLANLFIIDKMTSTAGTDNEKGTGLGLILCKEFVEMHKGKITATSELGKGTKFIFTMPQ